MLAVAACVALGAVAVALPTSLSAAPVLGDPCPNGDIRKAQGVAQLPDCMALEQVSPQFKHNKPARILYQNPTVLHSPDVGMISPDGDRVAFKSATALAGTPGFQDPWGDFYVGTREAGQGGWATDHTSPPRGHVRSLSGGTPQPMSFSADLSRWFHIGSAPRTQYELGLGQPFRAGVGGSIEAISPLLVPLSGEPPSDGFFALRPSGAAADGSRLYFQGRSGGSTVTYLPDDPSPALPDDPKKLAPNAEPNTYIAGPDPASLQLLARDGAGKAWGGNCGARVGGNPNYALNRGAISADGSRTYFTTRPAQPFDAEAGEGPQCSIANKKRIMVREETPAGPAIEELFESECDRVADPGPPVVPACGKTPAGQTVPDNDDLYQGASIEGDKVYFTTSRQLADSDVNGFDSFEFTSGCPGSFGFVGGCDLYLYDAAKPAGERLTQVTAGGSGQSIPSVAAISGDGSRAYFTLNQVLTTEPGPEGKVAQAGQPNLYLYERGPAHPDGRIVFIAPINLTSISGGSPYPVPVLGPDPDELGAGGDGQLLFFASTESLTTDDEDGGFGDVFRYDARDETLVRISKADEGGADNGPFDASAGLALGNGSPFSGSLTNTPDGDNSPAFVGLGRWVSEDGETVAFKTQDGLAPGDNNEIVDSYLWRGGQLFRLPGTADDPAARGGLGTLRDHPLVSADGDTVAFQTFAPLLPRDTDTAIDVYAARVEGGFPEPLAPPACVPDGDEACQGAAAAPPAGPPPLGATLAGRGNLAPPPRRCNRKQVRRGGRCVAKRALARRACAKRKGRAKRRCVKRQVRRLNRAQQRRNRAANTTGRAGK